MNAAIARFHTALQAFAAERYHEAAEEARAAAALDPQHLVYPAAATYLDRVAQQGKAGVYISGEGFAAFIRGGGNIGLYKATSAALQAIYNSYSALRLLDIGVGDGMALLPALSPAVQSVDLVEPAEAMLARTVAALQERGVRQRPFAGTLQAFAAAHNDERWDLAQATYSLQSLPPAERSAALRWLCGATDRLLIVEFDVPDLFATPLSTACITHVLSRYQIGLAEYPGESVVIQGFLMPVMFGYFDPGAARTNYEQPRGAWLEDLNSAGFSRVATHPIYPYWWAPAYLIDART